MFVLLYKETVLFRTYEYGIRAHTAQLQKHPTMLLNVQYRKVPEISAIANAIFNCNVRTRIIPENCSYLTYPSARPRTPQILYTGRMSGLRLDEVQIHNL